MNKLLLPYDIYERHRKVAASIKKEDTVLDVGGELNHLSQFVKPKKLLVANLNTGDVIIKKNKLPFGKNSFDVVCSIDVLEHIPKLNRRKFIESLVNISKKKVILSFPIGTAKHEKCEREMLIFLKKKKLNITYLEEHVRYGLPKLSEIEEIRDKQKSTLSFSGNIHLNEILFKIFIADPNIKFVRRLVYYVKLLFNLITNPVFYFLLSKKSYSEDVNRAYLIISK